MDAASTLRWSVLGFGNSEFTFAFQAAAGRQHYVQYADLADPNQWIAGATINGSTSIKIVSTQPTGTGRVFGVADETGYIE